MKDYILKKLFTILMFVIHYVVIMTIVNLTIDYTPFTSQSSFIGIGLAILFGFYFTYAHSRNLNN
jgi:predicted membrane chloride channel (bestrophin family)